MTDNRKIALLLAVGAGLAALFYVTVARAQEIGDFGLGHAEWHHWYETGENGGPLMRPTFPDVRCCGGDCRPAKAVFRNGAWQVYVDRGWETVPEDAVKRNVGTPNGMAHVCASQRAEYVRPFIYCFVPPESGS